MWQNLRTVTVDATPTRGKRPVSPRFAFIDVMRLLAALQMIVGHTLDALLDDAYRAGAIFRAWTFVRGLTSTAFFVAAGLSFALASAAAPGWGGARRRLRRAAELTLLGFALRAPWAALWGGAGADAWSEAQMPDVLHCMGVALLLSELIFRCVERPAARAFSAIALGFACFCAAQPSAHWLAERECTVVVSAFRAACGAPFPLVPWLGYPLVALGIGVGCLTPEGVLLPRVSARTVARRLGAVSVVVLAGAVAFRVGLPDGWSQLSPGFMLLKLGVVLSLATLLAFALGPRRLPPVLTKLSSETLFLYASHVVVLYAGQIGLRTLIGHRLPLWGALTAAFALSLGAALGSLSYGSLVPALRRGKHGGTPRPQRRSSPPG